MGRPRRGRAHSRGATPLLRIRVPANAATYGTMTVQPPQGWTRNTKPETRNPEIFPGCGRQPNTRVRLPATLPDSALRPRGAAVRGLGLTGAGAPSGCTNVGAQLRVAAPPIPCASRMVRVAHRTTCMPSRGMTYAAGRRALARWRRRLCTPSGPTPPSDEIATATRSNGRMRFPSWSCVR